MGKHVKQLRGGPKLFFPKALAQHLGPQQGEINASHIKNAESTIHHKASRLSYLFNDSQYFLFLSTHVVYLSSLTCKNYQRFRVLDVSYLRDTQTSKT